MEQILAQRDCIDKELHRRKLNLEEESWILLVVCSRKYEDAWEEWNPWILEYALQKLGCEILEEQEEEGYILHENTEDLFYMMKIYHSNQKEMAEGAIVRCMLLA